MIALMVFGKVMFIHMFTVTSVISENTAKHHIHAILEMMKVFWKGKYQKFTYHTCLSIILQAFGGASGSFTFSSRLLQHFLDSQAAYVLR